MILSSIGSLSLPLAAMLVLDPTSYGAFSLFYLVGAFANSLQLSVVSEAWVRKGLVSEVGESWHCYINSTILVASVGGAVAAMVALVMPPFRSLSVVAFLAVFGQVYWNGSRFRAFRELSWRYVLPADLAGAIATLVAAVFLFALPEVGIGSVMVSWAGIKWIGVLGSRRPGHVSAKAALAWLRSHRSQIAVLVSDGAISDLSSIGTPYILTPIMGVANLGTYRAVSNIGAPIRSLIAPLRPMLTRIPLRTLGSVRLALVIAVASTVFGLAAFLALWGLSSTDLNLGTLNSLYPFASAVGIYIFALMINSVYSLSARQVASAGSVIATRTIVSAIEIFVPTLSALLWGLDGAIWAYVICLSASAATWWLLVHRSTRSA